MLEKTVKVLLSSLATAKREAVIGHYKSPGTKRAVKRQVSQLR